MAGYVPGTSTSSESTELGRLVTVPDFHSLLLECARQEGFPLAGALDLDLAAPAMTSHIERYDQWLQARRQGAMQYLERGRDRRADPRIVLPGAQSILCVAIPYPKRPGGAPTPDQGPRYARYIHGRDYHEEIAGRLELVMQNVALRWTAAAPGNQPLKWKVCVDTSAVLERSWAALAGLGWIGKNTLLIHPQLGSYLFLGEVLINHPTGQGPQPLPDYCGNCTRCLKACPTQAITETQGVDSNRCISYWTLEKRGALELPELDKKAIGPWVAGCDICQEVCPFNFKPVKAELALPGLESKHSAEYLKDWEALLIEDTAAYKARIADSALNRVKPAQFSRNLAVALGNSLSELFGDKGRNERIEALVRHRLEIENDPAAREEWERCLGLLNSFTV
jgi:epoxyqueuosine reductase